MASVQIFIAEIRVHFQGRRCIMLVDVVHPRKDAGEPCKLVLSQCQTTQYHLSGDGSYLSFEILRSCKVLL
jgi:hypothetical protein